MPSPRFLQPEGDGYYHCVSRVVDRRFVFDKAEKRHFRKWMRKLEAFCGVQIVTYCLMSNHFHLLVRVPDKAAAPRLTEAVLRKLLKEIYSKDDLLSAEQDLDRAVAEGEEALATLLERYEARRHSLPVFMRELKQRFTKWFNRRHSRKGTLWEDRYRSVLVEGDASTLAAVAAYIDLNPVRAGLADSPEDDPWTGYAEACSGSRIAQRGLLAILAAHPGYLGAPEAVAGVGAAVSGTTEGTESTAGSRGSAAGSAVEMDANGQGGDRAESDKAKKRSLKELLWPSWSPSARLAMKARKEVWERFAAGYRLFLFEAGVEIKTDAQTGSPGRRGFDAARVESEFDRRGRLPWTAALRCRVRHFSEGAAMGSEGYLERIFGAFPERFGPKRKSGARKLRGIDAGETRCLRDLQAGS